MRSNNMRSKRILVVLTLLASALLTACGGSTANQPKTYTIGALLGSQNVVPVWDGFKAGLADLGYVEGKNVVYVYDGVIAADGLKAEAEKLKSQNLDLLATMGSPPTQAAFEVFKGTKTPILFTPIVNPVGQGYAASNRAPGGNMTGIISTDTVGKSLEWLMQIVPTVKRIYVPNNPKDAASASSLVSLTAAAKTQGVELVVSEGSTSDEFDTITKNIPENVDAVFQPRASSIGARFIAMVQVATARHLPTFVSDVNTVKAGGVLVGYGPAYPEMGKQLARMADKVLKGTDPGTLPIEDAEAYLGINLVTAQALGLTIPDAILRQATVIVRPEGK